MSLKVTPGLLHKFEDIRAAQSELKKFMEATRKNPAFTGAQSNELYLIYDVVLKLAGAVSQLISDNRDN